jgi:hypothetical protein
VEEVEHTRLLGRLDVGDLKVCEMLSDWVIEPNLAPFHHLERQRGGKGLCCGSDVELRAVGDRLRVVDIGDADTERLHLAVVGDPNGDTGHLQRCHALIGSRLDLIDNCVRSFRSRIARHSGSPSLRYRHLKLRPLPCDAPPTAQNLLS